MAQKAAKFPSPQHDSNLTLHIEKNPSLGAISFTQESARNYGLYKTSQADNYELQYSMSKKQKVYLK